jgi:lysophospholipase
LIDFGQLANPFGVITSTEKSVSERALTAEKISAINNFWQSVSQKTFITADNLNIAYAVNFKASKKPYIVIVPGRTEGYLKYQELSYDLDQQGYNSVIIDHRGQGLSQRLLENSFKGYVAAFDDYAEDLHQLLSQILPDLYPQQSHQAYMLAHSMGGAIALRYLQKYQHNIQALVLSSPMISVSTGAAPNWLAKTLVAIGTRLNHWLSDTPWYFLGQKDFNITSFNDNELMHSKKRYQHFLSLYQNNPKLQLGGVTINWLAQALKASDNIFNDIGKITPPVLMMQASEECLVDNSAQNEFCQQLHNANPKACLNGKPKVISGAYHELFFELDEFRDVAIEAMLAWYEKPH